MVLPMFNFTSIYRRFSKLKENLEFLLTTRYNFDHQSACAGWENQEHKVIEIVKKQEFK